ncbi:antitoxin [Streptomyces sp. NPDC046866]|uniref:antitoxin n=1 Tax=Streptomyces sp. NPDC046866 TaxID=3154921 RepID=UPI0034552F85
MGMMDKLKHMLKGHESQTDRAIDKGGDMVDERTQSKYQSQVDMAQEKLRHQFGTGPQHPQDRDNPPQA